MQSYSHFSGDLTLLYTETKKKALSSIRKNETTPALSHLDRKLRIQKDRLITWGLEWTDQNKGSGGDIDESVARAGMTETVTSVLGNIAELLEQSEKLKSSMSMSSWSSPEKASLSGNDEAKYEDLLKDLSTSVDILYEISRTRRAIATGSHPTFSSDNYPHEYAPGTIVSDAAHSTETKLPFQYTNFASSDLTLVNPSFSRPNLSPYAGLPASLDPQALRLPAEAPPPYESFGIPSATRMIARLIKSRVPESVRSVLKTSSAEAHVLVEFANYDPLYHETGVPPPLQRLEGLAVALQQAQARQQRSLILLGYFEDLHQPRIGLVYDFLGAIHGGVSTSALDLEQLVPVSLLNLVQAANKGAKPADVVNATPFLEDRFRVALRVAENLRDLHAEGYSHGNLNSGSIIFFRQGQNPQLRIGELHRPTLSAFDMFSRTRIERGNSTPNVNITKHPHDHDGNFDPIKAVQFDLYGLALLLLEIGLWVPLHDLHKPKYSLRDFKLRIEKIWVPRLASKCGSLYMRAVQTCLRLSDDPDISKMDPGKVYEGIIRRLQRSCLIDEDEPIIAENETYSTQHQPAPWRGLSQSPRTTRQKRNVSPVGQASLRSLSTVSTVASDGLDRLRPFSNIATTMESRRTESPAGYSISPIRDDQAPKTTNDGHLVPTGSTVASRDQSTSTSGRDHPNLGPAAYPFREYRQKVMLIQKCWRHWRQHRSTFHHNNQAVVSLDKSFHDTQRRPRINDRHSSTGKPESQGRRSCESISRKCLVFPVKLPQPALDDWHSNLGLRISRIVERVLKDSTESSSIDLVGLGQDPFTAKPTILVTCASTARVKAALKCKFDYDRSIFDLKVRKGRISLSRGKGSVREKLAKRASGADEDDSESDYTAPLNPFFQKRALCGASIGAYLPSYGHLDPVSYGGVVLVEQEGQIQPYGMSVHHMLDPPDGDNEEDASPGAGKIDNSDSSSGSDIDSADVSEISDSAESEDDETGYVSSEFESDLSEDEKTMTGGRSRNVTEQGDTPGVKVRDLNTISVTQPAFRDAWEQDLHADDASLEDLDEDHLSSYKFGKVYASSGLKRMLKNGMRHEIDWALIKLEPPRVQPFNLVQGGRRYCTTKATFCPNLEPPVCRQTKMYTAEEDLYPVDIVPMNQLANLKVHCFGRTSGLETGTISPGMSFVKIRGRRNFSSSWSVIGGFGVGGDSGAWVICNTTGRVCGHVLAERSGMTYICSMQLLFEDMKKTLGANSVSLPGMNVGDEAATEYTAAAALTEGIADAVAALDLVDKSAGRSRHGQSKKHVECSRLSKQTQTQAVQT